MTADEYGKVLAACESREEQLWVRLSGEAGLRRGEIAGCVPSGSTSTHELVISASIASVKGKGLVERPPKSGKPRIVAITDGLAVLLAEHIDAESLAPSHRLFTSPTDDGPMKPDTLTDKVDRLIYRAGLITDDHKPLFSLHDLRRTAATLARERGVSIKVIRDQLGHGHAQMTTKHYIRARSNPRLSEFADAMNRVAKDAG